MYFQKFVFITLTLLSIGCSEPVQPKSRPIPANSIQINTDTIQSPPIQVHEIDSLYGEEEVLKFIRDLQSNKYFSYCNKEEMTIAKDSMFSSLLKYGVFRTALSTKRPHNSLDLRFYDCYDGEGLYERGGVIEQIINMRPLFKRIKFKLEYSGDTYVGLIHNIQVNGRTYTLARGEELGWGETIYRFTDMLNEELQLQGFNERFYILSDNRSESINLVFLTKKQFNLINGFLKHEERLQTSKEWVEIQLKEIRKLK